jgi:dihydrodipicolinate synthase/N-acetylneuraminate lyase
MITKFKFNDNSLSKLVAELVGGGVDATQQCSRTGNFSLLTIDL